MSTNKHKLRFHMLEDPRDDRCVYVGTNLK